MSSNFPSITHLLGPIRDQLPKLGQVSSNFAAAKMMSPIGRNNVARFVKPVSFHSNNKVADQPALLRSNFAAAKMMSPIGRNNVARFVKPVSFHSNNKVADQPALLRSLVIAFAFRSLESVIVTNGVKITHIKRRLLDQAVVLFNRVPFQNGNFS